MAVLVSSWFKVPVLRRYFGKGQNIQNPLGSRYFSEEISSWGPNKALIKIEFAVPKLFAK